MYENQTSKTVFSVLYDVGHGRYRVTLEEYQAVVAKLKAGDLAREDVLRESLHLPLLHAGVERWRCGQLTFAEAMTLVAVMACKELEAANQRAIEHGLVCPTKFVEGFNL